MDTIVYRQCGNVDVVTIVLTESRKRRYCNDFINTIEYVHIQPRYGYDCLRTFRKRRYGYDCLNTIEQANVDMETTELRQ